MIQRTEKQSNKATKLWKVTKTDKSLAMLTVKKIEDSKFWKSGMKEDTLPLTLPNKKDYKRILWVVVGQHIR